MTVKEIQDLIKLINRLELSEFKMKEGDFKLEVRTKHYVDQQADNGNVTAPPPIISVPSVPQPFPAQPAAPAPPTTSPAPAQQADLPPTTNENEAGEDAKYLPIKSPMVGTFYRSPSPDKGPYAKVGDSVAAGDTVCIIEAMKLFNEIESEVSGKIVKVMVEDAQPVEYDQVLFLVDPS